MPLIVEPIRQEDIPQCVEIRTSSLGLLVIGRPPPYPSFKTEQISSIENNLLNSKHVHFMKVVDTEQENEILAFAKYEVYEHGRPDLERLAQPASRSDFEIDEFGALREAAHDYFCKRNGEMGKHPHICRFLRDDRDQMNVDGNVNDSTCIAGDVDSTST